MCRTGWMLLATALIASTRATNSENDQKAVETTQQDTVRHPREQNYREVIMFLTQSQIKHLKETQHLHGMILPTPEPNLSHHPQNEEIQQQLLKQEVNQHLPPQKLTVSEANHPQSSDTPNEVIQEQHKLEQHLQQQLQNQQLQNQKLQNQQLQNQQLQHQQLQNQQEQHAQHERLQEQQLQEQQLQHQQLQHNQNQVVNQHREQLIKEQILNEELERQQSQNNANLHNDEFHKINPNLKYHELSQQQYILSPGELLRLRPENEVKQLFYPEPEFINFLQDNNNKQTKLDSQLQIQLIAQPQLEMKQLEPHLPVNVHPDYQIIPYQYAPEQQHAHQQLGQQIFKQQIQFLQNSPKNYLPPLQQPEPVLKLNQQEEIELRKHILDHNVQSVQPKTYQEKAPQLNLEVHNVELPQKENIKNENLLQNVPKVQDLGRLDLLQNLKNEELRQKVETTSQFTHLDMLKSNNELQYAPNYSDVKFSISDIEKVIRNIQQEKQKAQATIEAIANSPPIVIKEEKVVKHRPIQIIKTVKVPTPYFVPVPQPFKVAVPQPYPVPLEIIKPYAVPTIKTEKVEVERPVPYDVEKRVNIDVEKKVYVHVNKPYPVERFVPIEIKKEIPIEIPVYKPKKLHIFRHVW